MLRAHDNGGGCETAAPEVSSVTKGEGEEGDRVREDIALLAEDFVGGRALFTCAWTRLDCGWKFGGLL